jgi:tripartite ATP-independent transporter DctM subunit
MALLMFLLLLVFLFTGIPVVFVLFGVTLISIVFGVLTGEFNPLLLQALPQRIYGTMQNFTLLAIPFFIFMGLVLERSKIAEQLLKTTGLLFGRLNGGVAISVVVIGALLATSTGVIGASVIAMGLISMPIMLQYKYSPQLACGVIVAAGSLGQILPPSIVLIVLGDQMGVSVVDLFVAAIIPGMMLVLGYIVFIAVLAIARPATMPAIPLEERQKTSGRALAKEVTVAVVPPLALILTVLGSIITGFATPTEAGAIGAIGAILLCWLRGQLGIKLLRQALDATARYTSMVLLILIGATAFALVFRAMGGDYVLQDMLTGLPGGKNGFVLMSLLTIFILGFFIDFFEIVFISIPVILPVAVAFDVDLLWYGILFALVIQTSFLTPPFGFALFYLRGVAPPSVSTLHIYQGAVPLFWFSFWSWPESISFQRSQGGCHL